MNAPASLAGLSGWKVLVEFRVLGPIEVRDGGVPVALPTGRTRSLLALLLIRAPHPVSVDGLIEQLWLDPPGSAKALVHNMVSGLRRATGGAGVVVSEGGGYRAELADHAFDLAEFRRRAAEGRGAMARGEREPALSLLTSALAQWRGPALAGAVEPLAGTHRPVLETERQAVTELRLDAELAAGRYEAVLDGVGELLAGDPYREEHYHRRMLALSGLGRRVEALDTYHLARRRLVDDLGIEPGRRLRDLHQQVLDGTAPPARPPLPDRRARPVPAQLPPTVERLVGRDELVTQVRAVLGGPRVAPAVVVLTGLGGVGKSALAVHAAGLVAADFADGRLYADLRGSHGAAAKPCEVLGRFLRALGVPGDDVPDDLDERVGRFRSELTGRRVLIVLDDARDERQVRALLPGEAGCAVVVTSRRRLDALSGAATFVVPTLAPAAARQLLMDAGSADQTGADQTGADQTGAASAGADQAGADQAGADQAGADQAGAEIAQLCGYLPLAIRIAGARLASRPDWTVAELRERLAGQRTRLDELAIGDLDVRASIALSYRSLPDGQRATLRRLGLLDATDVPGWVPAALSGSGGDAALDGLVGCHLVEFVGTDHAGQARFRLHDLVHEYARERALEEDSAADRRKALVRVLAGWLALAGEADQMLELDVPAAPPMPDGAHLAAVPVASGRAYDWFETERGNLLAAVHLAISLDEAELASDLAFRIGGFLQVRNYLSDRESITLAVVDGLERRGGRDSRLLRHLCALFAAYGQRDDVDQMAAIASRALCLATELDDQAARIDAMNLLSSVAYRRGRLADAVELARRCLGEWPGPDVPGRLLAESRWALAAWLTELGDLKAGLAEFRQVVVGGEVGGRGRAILLGDYAEALAANACTDEALAAVAEADEIVARIGDEVGAGRLALFRADVAIVLGDWPAARAHLEPALDTLTMHDDTNGRIFALRRLGDTAIGQGRADRATQLYRQALPLAERVAAPVEAARLLARLAIAADVLGDQDGADRSVQQCRRILTDLQLPRTCLRLPPHLRPALESVLRPLATGLCVTGA